MSAMPSVSTAAAETASADPRKQIIEVITGDLAEAVADAIAHAPDVSSADGLRPRAPRVPTTAEESLALRKAELKRRRKGKARVANVLRQVEILHVRTSGDTDALELSPGQIVALGPAEEFVYEPAAPAPFVVFDVAGDTP